MTDDFNVARIRELNDHLRVSQTGGRVLVTAGINALGPVIVAVIMREIAAFSLFTSDNDPYGEHDCAALTVSDARVLWKIDYYDTDQQYRSPDPSDPLVTTRVMTVMLAEEY